MLESLTGTRQEATRSARAFGAMKRQFPAAAVSNVTHTTDMHRSRAQRSSTPLQPARTHIPGRTAYRAVHDRWRAIVWAVRDARLVSQPVLSGGNVQKVL
ncbi:hypothetical protein VC83_03232 [Pseudogymnoascus destructans]|uniref:Uncharacterized protein n=1 Tax=Pseudogymnoascus destructans TaxID=655981 RepID=A0A177AHA8_9PEZI|nr:uncharacterized protein VC83_03232 [Pseudogymnoascus destructans]OAF60651.1 hypothetical protein VC83_03232 [Pseudogymnoascus destructans]